MHLQTKGYDAVGHSLSETHIKGAALSNKKKVMLLGDKILCTRKNRNLKFCEKWHTFACYDEK